MACNNGCVIITIITRVRITCVIATFLINNLNIDHSKGWKYLQHAQTSDNTINLYESTECVQDRIPDDIITKLIIILQPSVLCTDGHPHIQKW